MSYFDDYSAFLSYFGLSFIVILLIFLAILIVYLIGIWRVFEKAGKPGWASIIPIYGNWVLIEIAGLHWIYFVFLLDDFFISTFEISGNLEFILNLASLYAAYMYSYNISKRFNKGTGFSIFLFLFGIVGYPILGFSKNALYDESIPVSEHGVFGDNTVVNNTNNFNNNQSNDSSYNDYNNNEFSFCSNCGMKLSSDVRFCPNCGKEIIK